VKWSFSLKGTEDVDFASLVGDSDEFSDD
jgi:hypothetical protein